ncbi:MAG: chromosomal replication initiator protein DnaA [Lautropia sp.]|nr:chromosomal replication initiator protein DnaA [Lautropia sp.]
MQEQWEACSAAIATRMPAQAYRTWIQPLTFLAFDADACLIRLGAPNQIKVDVVRNQYLPMINQVLRDAIDPAMQVEVVVGSPAEAPHPAAAFPAPDAAANPAQPSTGFAAPQQAQRGHFGGRAAATPQQPMGSPALAPRDTSGAPYPSSADPISSAVTSTSARPLSQEEIEAEASDDSSPEEDATVNTGGFSGLNNQAPDEETRLNPALTFHTFVTGKANDMARAAALQVADRPGVAYNPLFILGGSGLGKTHLMQAIGNALHDRDARAKIRYVSAKQFVDDMVSAVRRDAMETFQRYYRSFDMLLIDDIQFLSAKQRTQEEFFYVFEALVNNRRQIVITCDTYPKELENVDERLISRLNSGLIVPIEPPELEMRIAILQRKAEQVRVKLPDDVAYFIAKNIRQNVRELEGALQRAIHYAVFRSQPVSMELVKEALKDILSFNRGQISIEFIQKTVADYYKIKLSDMYSKRKPAKIAQPRQIAMYLSKELTRKSLPEIGEAFGGKDHTTVLYAVRKITELRAHNQDLNTQIHVLEQTLREYL